jgi:hypothetical protein
MRVRTAIALTAVLLIGSLVAASAIAIPGARTGGTGSISCGDGTINWSPTTIWPPNHKMHTVTINYVDTDGDGDHNTITVDAILHDQADSDGANEVQGSGQPADKQGLDWTGVGNNAQADDPGTATTTVQVRAERSGTLQAGRTYTITVTCTQTGGDENRSETVNLLVKVPHDQGKHVGSSPTPQPSSAAKRK